MGIVSLNCPNCGAQVDMDDSREFGYCNMCGSKVMVDKMIVEHKGRVTIDNSAELNNLYVLARRARDDGNSANAQKYYEEIVVKDPSSWEANFYSVFFQSMNCTVADIGVAASRVANCEETVFRLIKESIADNKKREEAIIEVASQLVNISKMMHGSLCNYLGDLDPEIGKAYMGEIADAAGEYIRILYDAGHIIIHYFGEEEYGEVAAVCWKIGVAEHSGLFPIFSDKQGNLEAINRYNERIRKYDTSYIPPEINKPSSGHCYVATCVYGSYDCPQVWTLRRYRDDTLAATWYGRAFIRTYYAVSPTLVKWFGKTKWFKKMWQGKLDRIVKRLNASGVADTPYADKKW